jgi:hypothetical protein
MHKNATKCNETIGKWCKNKHGASKIIDTFETYQCSHNAVVLFDSGATHSFISYKFLRTHGLQRAPLKKSLTVESPMAEVTAIWVCTNCPLIFTIGFELVVKLPT